MKTHKTGRQRWAVKSLLAELSLLTVATEPTRSVFRSRVDRTVSFILKSTWALDCLWSSSTQQQPCYTKSTQQPLKGDMEPALLDLTA